VTQPFHSAPRRARRRARRLEEAGAAPGPAGRPAVPTERVRRDRTQVRRRNQPPPRRGIGGSGIAAVVVVAGIAVLAGVLLIAGRLSSGGASGSPSAEPSAAANLTPGPRPSGCPTSQPAALPAGQTRTVTIATSMGNIVVQVKADLAPIATGNFVALASCGFYDGLVFHRVVPDFVIQGGDPEGSGQGGPGYTIADDPVTTQYSRGTVAMARTPDPHSQGSQFFIVLSDDARTSLATANNYAILGTVVSGMDVVDAIAAAADQENPTNPVAMTSVTVANP